MDQARRFSEQFDVRFEVCSIVVQTHGFEAGDYHDFVNVVPTGSYALVYWGHKGYAVVPAGSTLPVRAINPHNREYANKSHTGHEGS